jgi:indolepyruvate ferredoxin oxidoreductase alpha subunit
MSQILLENRSGETHLLLGNDAIVRGAIEAGIGFVSCYPGTPSSEVPDTFFRLAPEARYYFEYSVNEKVAMEVAGGAALGGVSSLVTMKHVGVNVAADPLMTLAYIGTPGGLVILSADDPGCHSSQNEQDNRYYARLAGLPCLEPATAQECKDMTKEALRLSVKYEQPVLLRTTTRVNHLRGPVEFAAIEPVKTAVGDGDFAKNPGRFVPIPAVARVRHQVLLEKLKELQTEAENSPWNRTWGKGDVGVIASGVSRVYLKDVLKEYPQLECKVLELGFTYPVPEKLILEFLKDVSKVVILEELEPLLENKVRELVQKQGLDVQVLGKDAGLPLFGEYSTALIAKVLARALDSELPQVKPCEQDVADLPQRPPNLCPGCPHRSTYYAVRKVFGDDAVYSTDIGCYTLGILPPLKMADFLLCMGSSVSAGSGMARAIKKPVVAFIGDSTFFHSGITGLINAVYNNHDLLLVVLDNRTTAMTGHQPHPGVDKTIHGQSPTSLEIEPIVRACGVKHVLKVKALNQKSVQKALQELKEVNGVRVLIAEEPCPLYARRVLGRKFTQIAYVDEQCDNCMECVQNLACPAFYVQEGKVKINPVLCIGCMLCVQICEHIKGEGRKAKG